MQGKNEKVKTKNKKRCKKTGNKNKTKPAFLIYFTVTLSVVKNQKLSKYIEWPLIWKLNYRSKTKIKIYSLIEKNARQSISLKTRSPQHK